MGGRGDLAAAVDDAAAGLRARGRRPAVVPFGGSSGFSARGYLEAGEELLAQAPGLATVVTALGSGGTMAGLVAALGAERVLGVDCGAVPDPAGTVAGFVGELGAPSDGLWLRTDQVGAGYGVLAEPAFAAMTLAARREGLLLDPVYTGRALAGLIAAVRDGDVRPGQRTVLLHSGGLPGLFGHPETVARAVREVQPPS